MNAKELIELYINSELNIVHEVTNEEQLNEQLIKLVWRKLPSSIKSKIDMKKLGDFLRSLDVGDTLQMASRAANIPIPVATSLITSIERTGLI